MALQRLRQRHRDRRGVRRQGVRHLPAPARPRDVQRDGHRSSVVQEDRRTPRRIHLGRHVLHRGHPVPVHPARHPDHRTQRDPTPLFWKEHTSDLSCSSHRRPAGRGRSRRRAHHPGSVRAQQDQQQPARRARRRGGPGLPLSARRLRGRPAARPDPARPEPAEVRRPAAAREDQVRPRSVPHPRRRADHVVGRGGHPQAATSCTPTPTSPNRWIWTSS